jgi:hypothetical protein
MNSFELEINKAAQGLLNRENILEWFRSLPSLEKKKVLKSLEMCTNQSHPLKSEVDQAIYDSGLKATFTPCVLLKKAEVPEKITYKISSLPENEQEKAFRLLLSLFTIADKRRRETQCSNGCSHEWHKIRP